MPLPPPVIKIVLLLSFIIKDFLSYVIIYNAGNQMEGSFFFEERKRPLTPIDLTHELDSQRKLPLFRGEFRKRSKCDLTCSNSHGVKRPDTLIKLPDTFAVLDLDLKIA